MHIKKIVLLVFIHFLVFAQTAFAVPAKKGLSKYKLPNGSYVLLELRGDENVHWLSTEDNYTVLPDGKGFMNYAVLNKEGDLVVSDVRSTNIKDRTSSELNFLSKIPKDLKFSNLQLMRKNSRFRDIQKSANMVKVNASSNLKVLMLLVNFADTDTSYTQTDFENYMNQTNYKGVGSFKDFYYEVSYGQLNVTTVVSYWVTVSKNHSYYGKQNIDDQDSNPRELVYEACVLANAQIDFSEFDNDSDGEVEGLAIIHQGQGQEFGGADENNIWSHSWSLSGLYSSAERTFDGVRVNRYTIQPEIAAGDGETDQSTIGVMCHEFGHTLGAPDYYDTDYEENGQQDGTGRWDVMAGGSWNGNSGDRPAHMNMYQKIDFEWVTPVDLTKDTVVINMPNSVENTVAYRYSTIKAGEYFLMENRQQLKFDTDIPGHGLLIYHVDEDYISSNWWTNTINSSAHQGLYIKAAGGYTNASSAPFPGTDEKTEFTDFTVPNSISWDGIPTVKPVTNITESNGIISFQLNSTEPKTIYVNKNASGADDGTSWIDAFTDLNDGLEDAISGDEIFVAGGVYYPNTASGFVLKPGVDMYGGFVGNEDNQGLRNFSSATNGLGSGTYAAQTILSGDIDNATNPDNYSSWPNMGSSMNGNANIVVDAENITIETFFDGFTIEGAYAVERLQNGAGISAGTGMVVSNVTVQYNVIAANKSYGAGVYVEGASFKNSTISNNFSASDSVYSAGIYATGALVQNCLITDNILTGADAYGAGAMIVEDAYLVRAIVANNQTSGTEGAGAGVFNDGYVLNSLIVNNEGSFSGGGVYNQGGLLNCTVVKNGVVGQYVKGVFNDGGTIENTLVWGGTDQFYTNGGTISNSAIEGYSGGISCYNLSSDNLNGSASGQKPYFVNPNAEEGLDNNWSDYDYRIASPSKAIDRGLSNELTLLLGVDINNNRRVFNKVIDMGAFEYEPENTSVTIKVIDKQTQLLVPSCNVFLNETLSFTDGNGEVVFENLETLTSYNLEVYNYYYNGYESNIIVGDTGSVYLVELESYPVGVEPNEEQRVVVYPHPITDHVSFAFTEGVDTTIGIKVYDLKGKMVAYYNNVYTQEKIYHTLAKGIYVFEIILLDQSFKRTVIVQ